MSSPASHRCPRRSRVMHIFHHIIAKKWAEICGWPFLGASPDGVIDDCTIIEIKCPYRSRDYAITPQTVPYLSKDPETGVWSLKSSHSYYYQVQGQLLLTGRTTCIFIVYTSKDMVTCAISADSEHQKMMLTKLISFWQNEFMTVLLQEKVFGTGCRKAKKSKKNKGKKSLLNDLTRAKYVFLQ